MDLEAFQHAGREPGLQARQRGDLSLDWRNDVLRRDVFEEAP